MTASSYNTPAVYFSQTQVQKIPFELTCYSLFFSFHFQALLTDGVVKNIK